MIKNFELTDIFRTLYRIYDLPSTEDTLKENDYMLVLRQM